jgi:hypothetical protein
MNKVCTLSNEWTLYADANSDPWLVHLDGRCRWPHEVIANASFHEAEVLVRAVQRDLLIKDETWILPGADPRFRAIDKARMAMEIMLLKRMSEDVGSHSLLSRDMGN